MLDDPRRSRLDRQVRSLLRATPLRDRGLRWLVGLSAGLAVLCIGAVDESTGPVITLSVAYLLPIAAAAVLVSTRVGYLIATIAVLVWSAAEALGEDQIAPAQVLWNGTLRFAIFVFIVFLLGNLREAVEDAERAGHSAQQFLSSAAHQLRTPISGLMVSAEALTVESDPDRRRRLTDHLISSTERIGRLLTGLLELARSSEASLPHAAPHDVVELVRSEVDCLVTDRVKVVQTGESTARAALDPGAFREAFANVLDNAVRRADRRVEVEVELADEVIVWVRDDGAGVPVGREELVFERFRSFDDRGGVGLGLPIARALMRAMGGDVQFRDGKFVLLVARTD